MASSKAEAHRGRPGSEGEVLVVGGGIVGLSVAHALSRAGWRVRVFDDPRPGAAATRAAAGMLSPLSEASEPGPFLEAGLQSLALYPEWVRGLEADSGVDPRHRPDGKLRVARTPAGLDALADLEERARAAGVQVTRLGAEEAARTAGTPLGPLSGALLLPRDHQVDNRLLHGALAGACARRGVRVHEARVEGLARSAGRATGVRLADGTEVGADTVVLAAGAWSATLPGLPEEVRACLPIRPVRGQMIALDAGAALPHRVVESEEVYLVPRDGGRLLAGATVEEAGFRATCTDEARTRLHEAAIRILPALSRAPVVEHWCGLRPATPDGNPVLGPVPGINGLVVAGGHYRNGILLAPWTGAAVARILAGCAGPEIPPAFLPDRFGPEASDSHGPSPSLVTAFTATEV
jgi:glycine oxidase